MIRSALLAVALLSCSIPRPLPAGVADVAGVCGGVVVDGWLLTAIHCVDASEGMPIRTQQGLQRGGVVALDDAMGHDLAWVHLDFDAGEGAELGAPPVPGQIVDVWLASTGVTLRVSVTERDTAWNRARLGLQVQRGDSGSPVFDVEGRVVCIVTAAEPKTRLAVCSWPDVDAAP